MTTNYTPQHGRALVINGPQGSGKTQMARKIAVQRGTFSHLEFGSSFKHELKEALLNQPSTLIVDGNPSQAELADIKCIVTSQRLALRPPFASEVASVPAPFIIICTQDKSRWLEPGSRRFDVVELR